MLISFRFLFFKHHLYCKLWDLRGLPSCPYHGFSKQSWITGYCRECGEIPIIPPMDKTCIFCKEEKAVKQIPSPNGDKKLWSICWECDKFIQWSQSHSVHIMSNQPFPDFPEWLFKTEQVYPKHSYQQIRLDKVSKL